MKLEFFERFWKNIQISNFLKIRLVETESFHGDSHYDANSRCSQFCERAYHVTADMYLSAATGPSAQPLSVPPEYGRPSHFTPYMTRPL
jgi:hypothetical protein